MPVGRAAAPAASILEIGTAGDPGLTEGRPRSKARPERPAAARAAPSVTEPQVRHSPQRPAHFVVCQPHSEHSKSTPGDDLAMAGTVTTGYDIACGPAAYCAAITRRRRLGAGG